VVAWLAASLTSIALAGLSQWLVTRGTCVAQITPVPISVIPTGQQFQLGNGGWAYLAALNNAESTFGTNNGSGTSVLSGSNSAGAA
jgi:hypothetical protein